MSDFSKTPEDVAHALTRAGLADFFADCTPAHRREYFRWIDEAKKTETRQSRIAKTIEMLGKKRVEEIARAKKKSSR